MLTRRNVARVAAGAAMLIVAPLARAAEIPIANASFERRAEGPLPVGWRMEGAAPETRASVVDGVGHSGHASLRLFSGAPVSLTVVSEPVRLEVGRLYRLRGFVRTENLFSDPVARYPTAVPACLSMASFPFTNHSAAVGATRDWTEVETLFIATKGEDRVRLHLGYNGTATGTAWFDDLSIEEVEDIGDYIPPDTVRWQGDGYRYDDRGWIFVHIEGPPYERGFQFGTLVADELSSYIAKLGVLEDDKDPVAGWATVRFQTDAMMLRKYDLEYLTEMKGIADGARRAGAKAFGRELDLLDVVAVNSVVDLGQMHRAMGVTPHALSGQSFLSPVEEMAIPDRLHKCSSFVATGPATADGQVVFGQIFMWGGYTGVHWNVIVDLVPTEGHRIVYQTFPGGIHSGADFYINNAGIVIGETTVAQTPYDAEGTPQSNRIRKAVQYGSSIDDVVRILSEHNNGMYTNDWPMADVKTGEAAILLLGTHAQKLWRTGEDMAPFGTPGFLWANNNARDMEVRKEYAVQPDDAPFDLIFSPWNRDVAFWSFYQKHRGTIDSIAGVNLWASSPINRAHACDGKITTTEMARKLVFLAHYGKVTLREKFPEKGSRRMPDLPGAIPHLSLGYSVASPVFVTEKLKEARARRVVAAASGGEATPARLDVTAVEGRYRVDVDRLWRGTVYPAGDAAGWLVSGSAAYWGLLHSLPRDASRAYRDLADSLAELTSRFLYTVSREGDMPAVDGRRAYDRYGPYQIPRIKGTFALHQLRLFLGNEAFLRAMDEVHRTYGGRAIDTDAFIRQVETTAGRPVDGLIRQWLERPGLPELQLETSVRKASGAWLLSLKVTQAGDPYHLFTTVAVDAGDVTTIKPVEVSGRQSTFEWSFKERPARVTLNPGFDVPVAMRQFYAWPNFVDDFHRARIVYGTSREIDANHTLALRWQTTLADAYVEVLPPLVKDVELTAEDAAANDLIILGQAEDNDFLRRIAGELPVELGKNWFRWRGRTYADARDGLFLVVPNPLDTRRVLYVITANSALELYQMTRRYTSAIPSWAVFRDDEVVEKGYHAPDGLTVSLSDT